MRSAVSCTRRRAANMVESPWPLSRPRIREAIPALSKVLIWVAKARKKRSEPWAVGRVIPCRDTFSPMPHDVTLITTIAAGLGLALIMGFLATRVKLPPLVGYLVAGILIGPATPGFVADMALSQQLAEIGVILLMFGVGLHFSLADLLAVKKIAV